MSPLNIEAERRFGVEVISEVEGDLLEKNPVRIIRKDGDEVSVEATDAREAHELREFVPVSVGEIIVLPDVDEGALTLETNEGLVITAISGISSKLQDVDIRVITKGHGIGEKGEIPISEERRVVCAGALEKKPFRAWSKGQKLAIISWEKGEEK